MKWNTSPFPDLGIIDVLYTPTNELVVCTINALDCIVMSSTVDHFERHHLVVEHDGYVCNTGIDIHIGVAEDTKSDSVSLITQSGATVLVNPSKFPSMRDKTVLCAIVFQETPYVRQFVQYHLHFGVDCVIIYDNYCTGEYIMYCEAHRYSDIQHDCGETLESVLHDYIESGQVVIIEWPVKDKFMGSILHNHAIYAFRDAKYLGFMDIDEYVGLNPIFDTIPMFLDHIISESADNVDGVLLASRPMWNVNLESEASVKFFDVVTYLQDADHWISPKTWCVPSRVQLMHMHHFVEKCKGLSVDLPLAAIRHYMFLNKFDRNRGPTNEKLGFDFTMAERSRQVRFSETFPMPAHHSMQQK